MTHSTEEQNASDPQTLIKETFCLSAGGVGYWAEQEGWGMVVLLTKKIILDLFFLLPTHRFKSEP